MPLTYNLFPATGARFKDVQNFLVGENLVRKSAQLAQDLELIKQREANPEAFAQLTEVSTTSEAFDKRIEKSIEEIIDIRTSLGITQPAGKDPISPEDLLSPDKGTLINSLT